MLLNLLFDFGPHYRENHKAFFSKSDLFFVCMLQPRSFDIQKQNQEIEAAQVLFFSPNNTTMLVLLSFKLHQTDVWQVTLWK
jgi:hypothetical protein